MSDLHAQDPNSWLETVWDALHAYREDLIPEGDERYDAQWDDICSAMHWIDEAIMGDADDGYVTIEPTQDRTKVPALDVNGKFIYNEGGTA
jgi:hypothetical protein